MNPSIIKRRIALKKLVTTAAGGAVLGTQPQWLKPVVESVLLPAHASGSNPLECYEVLARVFDFSFNGSGGNGEFKIELTSDAPDLGSAVVVDATVDYGALVGVVDGEIYDGSTLIFGWFGSTFPSTPIPDQATTLSVNWTCANNDTGVLSLNLQQMVIDTWVP